MSARILVTTGGVNVTEFDIGGFGNKQTDAVGANLFKQICTKVTSCIRQLGGTRAGEVQAHRFLENDTVTIDAINKRTLSNTNESCADIKHLLRIEKLIFLVCSNILLGKIEISLFVRNMIEH